jgi:hypothetical protein
MSAGMIIAIPAFNEAGTVGAIVSGASAHAPVIVVDDGSTDATSTVARDAGATVVKHPTRRGKGAALATAVIAARALGARRLVTLDADGQHDVRDLAAVIGASASAPRAIVIGSRVAGDEAALPRGRGLAIRFAGFWFNWVTGTPVGDTQSGFRVYPMALFDEVRLSGGRFLFETEVLVEALARGWQVREVPIRVIPYAPRQSRFRPLADGAAISAYLSSGALARWGTEIAAGAREVGLIFTRERRVARHSRMMGKASSHAGTPSWGAAVGVAALDEVRERAKTWWKCAGARRARRVALATMAMPVLAAAAGAGAVIGGRMPRTFDRIVRALYDQRALEPIEHAAAEDRRWLPVTPR